jgi:peptidoglycan/LPS O-acetylase OafA/YrhL
MWVVRELLRLLGRIAVAVAIAALIAGVKAALSGGDFQHTWRIMLLLLGCLMLLLGMAGSRESASNFRSRWGVYIGAYSFMRIPGVPRTTGGPTLTTNAVFVGTAFALFALAFVT